MRLIQALACTMCVLAMAQCAGSAFSVGRTSTYTAGSLPRLMYEVDLLGNGTDFDLTTSTYTVREAGLYWIHVTAGIPQSTQADVRVNLPYYQYDVVRSHVSFPSGIDTTARTILTSLDQGHQLYVNSIYTAYSDFLIETSFGGFNIDTYMTQTVAFLFARRHPLTSLGAIDFDEHIIDTAAGWDDEDKMYITKVPGTYVINFMTGLQAGVGHTVNAVVNGVTNTAIYITDTIHAGEDTASSTFLATLGVNDRVSFTLVRGSIYSDIRYLTSFSGFLYTPRSELVAWQLYRTTQISGPVDPISFDIVALDTAVSWDQEESRYTVGTAGVYCINLSAGMVSARGVGLTVMINGINEIAVYRSSINHNGFDTRGRSLIVRFDVGDELRASLAVSFVLYSDTSRITSFSGFRIY